MNEIRSTIAPGPKSLRAEGDVPLPILWGNVHETLTMGGFLEPTGSDGTTLTADADGHIYLRAGTVLVKNAGTQWRACNETATATAPDDDKNAAILDADAVGILKTTVDLKDGGGHVGIFIGGGFIASRMPSVADNAVAGLSAEVRAALRARGFKFAEDY